MEDEAIVALYWARDEAAIRETEGKYGPRLRQLAQNILTDREDSEECVSDGYLRAWNAIPPERPRSLFAFLGKLVREGAIDRLRRRERQKRRGGRRHAGRRGGLRAADAGKILTDGPSGSMMEEKNREGPL